MPLIVEWVLFVGSAHRFAWGERYLYIKIVVIGIALFCGQKVKVLLRTYFLSYKAVDKTNKAVDKTRWDLT
jgi:hypothetical protein